MEFDGVTVEDAFRAVLDGEADDPVTVELTAPDGLGTAIAVELSTSLTAMRSGISDGATAALCGMLVGARLSEPGERIPESLPAAVETVRVLGRTRVIAQHCDLAAVARIEGEILRGFGLHGRLLRESLTQLFELGLAIGLAARYA